MDFPIEERSGEVPLKPEGRRLEHPKEAPPPPPFGHGVSSQFEDDLMREFETKHSNLSSFLDERVSDLTFSLSSQVEERHEINQQLSNDPFFLGEQQSREHRRDDDYDVSAAARKQEEDLQKFMGGISHQPGYDPFEAARKQEENLRNLVGDFGGSLKKTETDPLKSDVLKTEEAAGGDQGKFGDEADQLMSHFERVSPNIMEYNYDGHQTRQSLEKAQEVPFSFGGIDSGLSHGLSYQQQPHQQQQPRFGADDDEDDFERDSISQQSQSQPLSNKLSDSLEALKDIPREMPPPKQDHFAPPSSLRARGMDEEDDFEKDSISSHPLSQKLSDSLEVLKDSPQKDLRLDESLMDLDELPSSKNSVNSISPNDVPNIVDDFVPDVAGRVGGVTEDLIGKLEEPVAERSPMQDVSSGNPFMESEKSTSSQLSSDFSGPMAASDLITGVSNLPEVTQSASFAPPDVGNVFGDLPEVASSIPTAPASADQPKDIDDVITSHQNLPDLTAASMEAPMMEEEVPPPIPPHKNLTFGEQNMFGSMSESQIGINSVHSPFDQVTSKEEEDLIAKYGVEDPMLEESIKAERASAPTERPTATAAEDLMSGGASNIMSTSMTMSTSLEAITQPKFYESEDSSAKTDAPLLDFESKDQQSVSEELDDLLQPETEPVLESIPKSKDEQFVPHSPPAPREPEPIFESVLQTTKPLVEALSKSGEPELFESIPQEIPEPIIPEPKKAPAPPPPVEDDDDDIPPPVPPHRQPLHESPKHQDLFEDSFEQPSPVKKQVIEEPQKQTPKEEVRHVPEEKPKAEPKVTEPVKVVKKPIEDFQPVEVSEEVQLILNTFNPRNWFHYDRLHPKVAELVYWRDPKKSGIVFGSVLVVLLSLAFLSLISVVAYTSLAILSGTLAFRVYKSILQAIHKTQDGHPFKEYLELDLTVSQERAQELSTAAVNQLNRIATKLRSLFLVEDIVESAKFGALLYCLTYIGAWFNGLTLVILAFIALFAAPIVYETNKTIIDQYIDLVSAKISEINAKVTAAIPFLKKEKAQ